MVVPTIRIEYVYGRNPEFKIEILPDVPPRFPNPTEAEMENCPASFRCFACLERKGKKKHFAGEVLEKRICRTCYPYADEAEVGRMIRFDMKHGFHVD